MNKYRIGAIVALFATFAMCMMAFVNVGMAVPITFEDTSIDVKQGKTYEIPASLDYNALNTTSDQSGIGYDDDLYAVTDFDYSTSIQITNGSGEFANEAEYSFNIDPLTHFDGVWMKKSTGVYAYVEIMNHTNGNASLGYLMLDGTDYQEFTEYQNLSYQFTPYVEDQNYDVWTLDEYVGLYGAIDNVTVTFSAPHGGMMPFVPESPTFDHELLWYEFHLFNALPYITDVEITNAGEVWNVPQPWGLSADRVSGGDYIITVTVPKTAEFGSYFLTVTDNLENEEHTILVVTQDTNSIWIWIYPLIMVLLTIGLWGYADHVNDSGKNPSAVVLLLAGGLFTMAIAVIMVLDITGYWATGIVPMGLIFGAVALGSGGLKDSIKRHKRTAKKVFAALIAISALVGFSALAISAAATYTASPSSITASPGEKITVNFYSDDVEITKNNTSIVIVKTDEETPYAVYWTYTKNVVDDKLSGSFVVTIPAKAATGVYTITIREGEIWSKSISLYVPEDAGLNWMIFMSLIVIGGLFLAALALGWAHVKRTPTFADNAGLIAVGFAGAFMWLLAVLYYIGYWAI